MGGSRFQKRLWNLDGLYHSHKAACSLCQLKVDQFLPHESALLEGLADLTTSPGAAQTRLHLSRELAQRSCLFHVHELQEDFPCIQIELPQDVSHPSSAHPREASASPLILAADLPDRDDRRLVIQQRGDGFIAQTLPETKMHDSLSQLDMVGTVPSRKGVPRHRTP